MTRGAVDLPELWTCLLVPLLTPSPPIFPEPLDHKGDHTGGAVTGQLVKEARDMGHGFYYMAGTGLQALQKEAGRALVLQLPAAGRRLHRPARHGLSVWLSQ